MKTVLHAPTSFTPHRSILYGGLSEELPVLAELDDAGVTVTISNKEGTISVKGNV